MEDGGTERFGAADLTQRIAAIDPMFGTGVAHLDRVLRHDAELVAGDKALILVATTAVRDPDGLADEVHRARTLGTTATDLRAVALALYLSRGARPCRLVLDTVDIVDPGSRPAAPGNEYGAFGDPIPTEEIVAEFSRVFGTVPERIALLVEHSHDGLEAYHRMRAAVLGHGPLEPRLGELMLMAVNAAEHRSDFAAVHAGGARRAGASEAQLVEAGLCAVTAGGVAAWLSAAEAIVATRSDARPTPTPTPNAR